MATKQIKLSQMLKDRIIEGEWSDAVESETERIMEEIKDPSVSRSIGEILEDVREDIQFEFSELAKLVSPVKRDLTLQVGQSAPQPDDGDSSSSSSDELIEGEGRRSDLSDDDLQGRIPSSEGEVDVLAPMREEIKRRVIEEFPLRDFTTPTVRRRIRREMKNQRFEKFSEKNGISSNINRFKLGAGIIIGTLVFGDTARRIYNFVKTVRGTPSVQPTDNSRALINVPQDFKEEKDGKEEGDEFEDEGEVELEDEGEDKRVEVVEVVEVVVEMVVEVVMMMPQAIQIILLILLHGLTVINLKEFLII